MQLTSQPFDPTSRWATSWLLSPFALFIFRSIFALYAWFTIFFTIGWGEARGQDAGRIFSFFTVLTYWGIASYGVVSAVHTATYWKSGRETLKSWPRALQVLHEVLYSTVVVYPWLVTIVFWAVLYDGFPGAPVPFDLYSNISQHALNSVFAFLEILLPRTEPLPWWHLIPVVVILALYLGLAYLTHATQGFYVYPFLDVQKNGSGTTAGYIIGILIAIIIIFVIVKYVIWLRVWVTESKMRKTGKFSDKDDGTTTQMESVHSKEDEAKHV